MSKAPKQFSDVTRAFLDQMPENVRSRILIDRRIQQVHSQFAQLVSPFILQHTNSLYLLKSKNVEGAFDLVVYLDNSTCAAELNARREIIRMKYREEFNVVIDVFEIRISRGEYKNQHPFNEYLNEKSNEREEPRSLTQEEMDEIEAMVKDLKSERLRESFKNALIAQKRQKHPKA